MAKAVVIDDSELVLDMVKMMLDGTGIEVVVKDSPLGASSFIANESPDLLLLDVTMPALSGTNLVEIIRKNPRLNDLKVVLFSDRPVRELERLALECDADGYMGKTSDPEEFVGNVRSWLER